MRIGIKRIFGGYKPVVVAALQSPHLLNIWADSDEWDLYYGLLGDHDGLEEARDLALKSFTSSGRKLDEVSAVLVTTPDQLFRARELFRRAKIYWVVHTGFFLEVFPSEHVDKVDGVITLTNAIMDIQTKHKTELTKKANFVITPFYVAKPLWSWQGGLLWTIRSRISTRMPVERERLLRVIDGIAKRRMSGEQLFFYGSEAPDGYITTIDKERIMSSSSGYISALPNDAGFGLAEHEALAAGVPIVGSRWGDMEAEMPEAYECLVDDEDKMIEYALRLARDKEFAEKMSSIGLEYIKNYRTRETMDAQIREFVKGL